jgi:hypothetical protein
MLAAALLAVPAIVVAEQPALRTAHAQQADTSKGKAPATTMKGKKKGKGAKKPAARPAAPAAKDTSKAK